MASSPIFKTHHHKFILLHSDSFLTTARRLDQEDELKSFREAFFIPHQNNEPLIYFCGNSLGLQPKNVPKAIEQELTQWQQKGVEGWFEGNQTWLGYHARCQESLARIVGASPIEVCPMNHLTVNLHLALVSFYRPTATRYKILTIASDFPSDQYALETQLKHRGYEPDHALVEVSPRPGEYHIRTEDIVTAIQAHADSLALVCMSGINYYTGQFFELEKITIAAHRVGALVGFDLAHAIGNVPLQLHQWQVDFAVWCSYKYLNSGPGGVGGLFVHQKHHESNLPRLAGWWGYDEPTRFEMTKGFVPMQGAAGWQLSTPTILSMATHKAALSIFDQIDLSTLYQKSRWMTDFLEQLILQSLADLPQAITIITPPKDRGCQLSLLVNEGGKELFDYLTQNGVIGDWREPNCIRLTPVPLYNTFEEVWRVGMLIESFLRNLSV
jgi:kynureninase